MAAWEFSSIPYAFLSTFNETPQQKKLAGSSYMRSHSTIMPQRSTKKSPLTKSGPCQTHTCEQAIFANASPKEVPDQDKESSQQSTD